MARSPSVRIKIDTTGLAPAQALLKRLTISGQVAPILDDVGEQLAKRMRASIEAGRTAQGRPAPKPADGRALFDTGALLRSIHHTMVGRRRVEIGTSLPYAGFVHSGSIRNRPGLFAFTAKRRAVIGDRRTIASIVREHLDEVLAERDAGMSAGEAATKAFSRLVNRRR